jgi:hypothetical protein
LATAFAGAAFAGAAFLATAFTGAAFTGAALLATAFAGAAFAGAALVGTTLFATAFTGAAFLLRAFVTVPFFNDVDVVVRFVAALAALDFAGDFAAPDFVDDALRFAADPFVGVEATFGVLDRDALAIVVHISLSYEAC